MANQGKSIIAFFIMISIILSVLVGCTKEELSPAGTISDFDSRAHLQVSASGNDFASGDMSRESITGEFVVSEKRYSYEGTDLMVLYIENQSNQHYNVTINGTYLDENGETLKEECQTFEGFAAGWHNYFIFCPKMAFDRFTYTVDTEEYVAHPLTSDKDGTPYVTSIELLYKKNLSWNRRLSDDNPPKEARDLCLNYTLVNHHAETTIAVEFYLFVLDSEGRIYFCSKGDFWEICGTSCTPVGGEDDGSFNSDVAIFQQYVGEDETIPENLQGVLTAVFAIVDVVDYSVLLDSISS